MIPIPIKAAVIPALLAVSACAPGAGAITSPASRSATASAASANAATLPDNVIAACRAEAERATVVQNRGEMMRLDEAENRGRDSLMRNQQERGLLVTTRDRLFRQCLARAGSEAAAAQPAGQQAPTRGAPAPTQAGVPR